MAPGTCLGGRLAHVVMHRARIPSRHRLCLFLRFIAHGTSYTQLSGEFAIGNTTACKISHEVARIIIEKPHSEAFPTPTASTWAKTVQEFRRQWDYPAAMGALDGKHVALPSNTGSAFFNYKGYFSIVPVAFGGRQLQMHYLRSRCIGKIVGCWNLHEQRHEDL
ncbi:hypothetical protein Q1695_006045 [Nippostrongylus brasiliensis]|nr:hypothetical protein Q1695_006045 [Nippostrongylus brasiliensis]